VETRRKIRNFLKRYILDILIVVFGTALSITITILTSNYALLVGIGETLFVELSLFSIRREIKSSFNDYLKSQMTEAIKVIESLGRKLDSKVLLPLLIKPENQITLQRELDRIENTFAELQNGKRRIYQNDDLYGEQQKIVVNASQKILAVHVVDNLRDLIRWDPEKMDKNSSFYSVLYSEFEKKISVHITKKRIITLLKWDISQVKERYNLSIKDSTELSDEDKKIKELYEVLSRVVDDQKRLGFKVRFITTAAVVAQQIAVCDRLIGDRKYGFEFSKSDSADVQAYAIESEDYIQKRIEEFEKLWAVSTEW
jgi:hypothetical protein